MMTSLLKKRKENMLMSWRLPLSEMFCKGIFTFLHIDFYSREKMLYICRKSYLTIHMVALAESTGPRRPQGGRGGARPRDLGAGRRTVTHSGGCQREAVSPRLVCAQSPSPRPLSGWPLCAVLGRHLSWWVVSFFLANAHRP